MAKYSPRICANCKHWHRFDVDYGDCPEDECGSCEKNRGEIVYGDEEACKGFSAGKNTQVRGKGYRK